MMNCRSERPLPFGSFLSFIIHRPSFPTLMRRRRAVTMSEVKSITVGISGASGVIYAQRLLMQLEASPEVRQINLVISGPARRVMADELDIQATADTEQMIAELMGRPSAKAVFFHAGDIGAA